MHGARHVADRRTRQPVPRAVFEHPSGRPPGSALSGSAPSGPSRPRRRGGRTLRWVAVGVAATLVVGAGGAAVALWRLSGKINAVDVSGGVGTTDRPSAAPTDPGGHEPVNVLVMGSDSRDGANGFIGGKVDGARSDTTLLLHLSADRTRALAVSIPRDSMVDMPSCTDLAGHPKPPGTRQFNDAFTIGGAACTQRTVEQLTGIRIDHYVVVDFAGFKGMVDALGGVPICLPKPVDDRRHHIQLPAGRSRVSGDQALAFVRERYALGDGGDLGRIGRQQAFISSVLQEATSAGTLTNPPKLYSFLSAATRSVTMDPQLASVPTLVGFAKQITDVGLRNIQFVTVPSEEYPPDHNRLQWAPAASRLWRAVRQDVPVTFSVPGAHTPGASSPSASTSSPGAGPSPSGSTSPSEAGVDPATVRLQVLNASGTPGAAAAAAAELREAGWQVSGVGDAGVSGRKVTRIKYGPGGVAERRARALAAVIPGSELVLDPQVGAVLRVEIGSDWSGVGNAASPSSGSTGGSSSGSPGPVVVNGVESRTADADICR